jgi:hypothetical protein
MATQPIPTSFKADDAPVVIKEDPGVSPLPILATGEADTTIEKAAEKDIEVQKQGMSFDQFLESADPKIVDFSKQDTPLGRRTRLNLALQHQKVAGPTPADQPIIPFMRDDEFVPTPDIIDDPSATEKAERLSINRKNLDNLLVGAGIEDATIRQIFIDEFETGNFYDSLTQRLAEAGQFLGTAIPLGTVLGINATGAWVDSRAKGTSWSEEWGARQNAIQGAFKETRELIDQYIPNPTMAMAFNSAIQKQLKDRLDNGRITQEEYDRLAFVTDADGNKVGRDYITEDTAGSLINLGFEELPIQEKFGVIFLETAAGIAGPGQAKGVLAMQKFNRLTKKLEGTDLGDAIRGKDPFEALGIIEASGVKSGINLRSLSVGVTQQRTNAAIDKLADQIAEAGGALDALRIQGVARNSVRYKVAKGGYDDLTNRMLRAKYTAKVYPYIKEAGTDALVISAGQLAARELIPMYTDISPESAEVIGAIGMIAGGHQTSQWLGGKLIKATTTPRGGAPRVFAQSMDFMANVASLGTLRIAGVKLTDDTIRTYETAIGRKLTGDEVKGIQATIKMVNTLNPTEREVVLNAVDDYVNLQDDIVMAFPESERAEVEELFSLSFSNATGLNFMSAITSVSANRLDVRDLKGMEIGSVIAGIKAANSQVELAETALANLQRKLADSEVSNPEAVTNFVTGTQAAIKSFKDSQLDLARTQQDQLDDIRKHVLADPTIPIPENFLIDLSSADKALREQLGEVVDDRSALSEMMTDVFTSLQNRMDAMKNRRGTGKAYFRELGQGMEQVIDAHMDSIWLKGNAAYANVRQLSEQAGTIDLTDAVNYMMDKAGETAYDTFFSPEGTFFAGKMGRQTMAVFNDMVTRALPNIDELRDQLKTAGVSQELVDGMTNIELAMELKRIQPQFEPFSQANAYEVDVMRRAFRDYAYKVRDGMPGLASEYRQYAGTLDNLIREQGQEVYTALTAARQTYRSEVGDRLRPGSFLYNVDMSRQGGKIVTFEGDEMFQYAYRNVNPLNMFKGVSNNLTKALRGNFDAEGEIVADVGAIVTQFADTVDGKRVFDLSTPEGFAKFQMLQRAVGEKVHSDWISREIKVFEKVSSVETVKQGGYKFDNLADEGDVNSLMLVPIRREAGGPIEEVPLVNLGNIYADARSLDEFVAGSAEARSKYATFVSEFKNVEGKARRSVADNIAKQDDSMDILKQFAGNLDADGFYSTYIIGGSEGMLSTLRDKFIDVQVAAGKSTDEAQTLFDGAVGRLIAKGFQNRGGLTPVATAQLPALQRDLPVARAFTTPENMLNDIRDHRAQLVAALGEDHVDYMNNIAKFLVRGKSQAVGLDGKTSGYSLNEGLSRLYNISRGMVSPLYVTSEFAVRLASRSNIELLELAAGNKEAAGIISKMFSTPELVSRTEVGTLDAALKEFVFTEMARRDLYAPELNEMFLLPEDSNEDE